MKHLPIIVVWLVGIAVLTPILYFHDGEDAVWMRHAMAQNFARYRQQVVLFQGELRDGRRIDRADPYLPVLDQEAEEARRLNYERCRVAIDQKLASGQIKKLRYDDPRTLFGLVVDGQRWAEDPDISMLEDVACVFTAGDVRRGIRYPVVDEHNHRIGMWWGRRLLK